MFSPESALSGPFALRYEKPNNSSEPRSAEAEPEVAAGLAPEAAWPAPKAAARLAIFSLSVYSKHGHPRSAQDKCPRESVNTRIVGSKLIPLMPTTSMIRTINDGIPRAGPQACNVLAKHVCVAGMTEGKKLSKHRLL